MSKEKRENAKIAIALKAARSILGLNLKQMAEVLDVAPSSIGKWENNELGMRATTYMKLIKYLEKQGISFDIRDGEAEDGDQKGEDALVLRVTEDCVSEFLYKRSNDFSAESIVVHKGIEPSKKRN